MRQTQRWAKIYREATSWVALPLRRRCILQSVPWVHLGVDLLA